MRSIGWMVLIAAAQLSAQTDSPSWSERWDQYVERTYSWKRIGEVAAETAFDQSFQLRKCGRPPYCFPRDFGGALAMRTTRTTIELGVGALLHEDVRRSPSNQLGFRRRFVYAVVHASLANGTNHPAYARFAGTLGGAAVSSAWRDRPISADRMAEGFGWSLVADVEDSLWTEFEPDVKRVGKRILHRR